MTEFTERELAAMRRAIIRWSEANGRKLPWRNVRDPYRVWISEVMLQQTTVAAVVPYYHRFLRRFPDVASLASANEADVLRLWEGLGYYSRARNLHRGAQLIATTFGGDFPRDVVQLQSVPGIGRYTAGAIASFAFDARAPIVEANTLRLHARLLGFAGDPRSSAGQHVLWSFAEAILPRKQPSQFNQALIDLGATVCTPSNPECRACPLKSWCRALCNGRVAEIPRLARRARVTPLWSYSIAVRSGNRYLLRKYPTGTRWAGLWDFPRWERETPLESPARDAHELAIWVQSHTGLKIELGPQIARFRHGVTRFRITAACFLADRIAGRLSRNAEWQWLSPAVFSQYAFSVTGRRFANLLSARD